MMNSNGTITAATNCIQFIPFITIDVLGTCVPYFMNMISNLYKMYTNDIQYNNSNNSNSRIYVKYNR